ncbi:VENN motif pre-toxin domain-containing protein [Cronobacter dublinensis]
MVKAQGGNAAAGAAGGFVAASGSAALSLAFYNKKPEELSPDEKTVIVNLVAALGAAGGSMAAGNSTGIGSGANAARVEVENNSLTGDAARQSVKQSAEWWKEQVRNKLGKNTASQLANGLINLASETGDIAMLGGDTAFDVMAALAACATGDSYCSQAKNDVSNWTPKDKNMIGTSASRAAQFNTNNIEEIRMLVKDALNSPNALFLPNNQPGSFRVVADLGKPIGTKGQTSVRIIVGEDGKIWNAFPVNVK